MSHPTPPAATDAELLAAIDRGVALGEFRVVDDAYLAELLELTDAHPVDVAAPFCEAAAEWDHDWSPAEDGPQVCGECGVRAYGGDLS